MTQQSPWTLEELGTAPLEEEDKQEADWPSQTLLKPKEPALIVEKKATSLETALGRDEIELTS